MQAQHQVQLLVQQERHVSRDVAAYKAAIAADQQATVSIEQQIAAARQQAAACNLVV